jgi:hypothetical protein
MPRPLAIRSPLRIDGTCRVISFLTAIDAAPPRVGLWTSRRSSTIWARRGRASPDYATTTDRRPHLLSNRSVTRKTVRLSARWNRLEISNGVENRAKALPVTEDHCHSPSRVLLSFLFSTCVFAGTCSGIARRDDGGSTTVKRDGIPHLSSRRSSRSHDHRSP